MKIESTKYSPEVELSLEGKMTIQGRSIIEDPIPFYDEIIGWVKGCNSKEFTLEIRLEYINTSSSKLLLNLLNTIKDCYNTDNITIHWFYEIDDEDMLDMAKDYESLLSLPVSFYEMAEIAA